MADISLLWEKIKDSGMTMVAIAGKANMKRQTLYKRLNEKGEFKASEIAKLSDVLRLSGEERDNIFFTPKSELKETKK